MWVWALFDLPVVTKSERKRATKFRKFLLDLGFEMVQFSVYTRFAASRELAESYAKQIGDVVPPYGKLDVLFFTDKQFAQTQRFRGQKRIETPGKPEQLSLF